MAEGSFTTNNPRSLAELSAWQAGPAEPVLEPGLPIIDPHHHLREGAAGRYHLPELADDLARGHDVRATVFVDSQSGYRSDGPPLLRPVGETESSSAISPSIPHPALAVPARRSSGTSISATARGRAKGCSRTSTPARGAFAASAIPSSGTRAISTTARVVRRPTG